MDIKTLPGWRGGSVVKNTSVLSENGSQHPYWGLMAPVIPTLVDPRASSVSRSAPTTVAYIHPKQTNINKNIF